MLHRPSIMQVSQPVCMCSLLLIYTPSNSLTILMTLPLLDITPPRCYPFPIMEPVTAVRTFIFSSTPLAAIAEKVGAA